MRELSFVGAAFGVSGADTLSAEAPSYLKQAEQLSALKVLGLNYYWEAIINEDRIALAKSNYQLMQKKKRFCVIGGDHSCAASTWSVVSTAISENKNLGLIWVDAHMDAHTHETTPPGREHGIHANEFMTTLISIGNDPKLVGYEIVGFSPHLDTEN